MMDLGSEMPPETEEELALRMEQLAPPPASVWAGGETVQPVSAAPTMPAPIEAESRSLAKSEVAASKASLDAMADLESARQRAIAAKLNADLEEQEQLRIAAAQRDERLAAEATRKAALTEMAQRRSAELSSKIAEAEREVHEHPEIRDRRSFAQKLLAGLADALVMYGRAITGQEIKGIGAVEASIEADLAEQQGQLDRKKRGVTFAVNDLDRFRMKFGNLADAADVVRLQALGDYERQAAQIAAGMKDTRLVQAAQEQINEARLKSQEIRDRIQQRGFDAVSADIARRAPFAKERYKGAGTGTVGVGGIQQVPGKAGQPYRLAGWDWDGETTVTPAIYNKAATLKGAITFTEQTFDKALQLRREHGVAGKLPGKAKEQMEEVKFELIKALSDFGKSGVLQPGEVETYKKRIGSLSEIGFVTARLEAMKETILGSANAAMEGYGFRRGAESRTFQKRE